MYPFLVDFNTPEVQYIFRVFVGLFLGIILGIQRLRSGKSAGPRTYGLVTAGAALVTVLSVEVFQTPVISGQILTGIGFLGAGLIFHKENHVDGLTTAAGLWMSATIGMAAGAGLYLVATVITATIFCLLMVNNGKLGSEKKK